MTGSIRVLLTSLLAAVLIAPVGAGAHDDGTSSPFDVAVTASEAVAIALERFPDGVVVEVELEYDIWEVELRTENGAERELWIDANTGEIIAPVEPPVSFLEAIAIAMAAAEALTGNEALVANGELEFESGPVYEFEVEDATGAIVEVEVDGTTGDADAEIEDDDESDDDGPDDADAVGGDENADDLYEDRTKRSR